MRHLSDDERSIRESRGISVSRFLPFLVPIGVFFVMSADQEFLQQCIGRRVPVEPYAGSGAARLILAVACSPYYLFDFSHHWWALVTLVISVAFAIPQIFWLKRHKAYWDSVRKKEKLKRAEKRAQKQASQETEGTGENL